MDELIGRLLLEREAYRRRYDNVARAVCAAARAGLLDRDVVAALACGSGRVFDALVVAGLREEACE